MCNGFLDFDLSKKMFTFFQRNKSLFDSFFSSKLDLATSQMIFFCFFWWENPRWLAILSKIPNWKKIGKKISLSFFPARHGKSHSVKRRAFLRRQKIGPAFFWLFYSHIWHFAEEFSQGEKKFKSFNLLSQPFRKKISSLVKSAHWGTTLRGVAALNNTLWTKNITQKSLSNHLDIHGQVSLSPIPLKFECDLTNYSQFWHLDTSTLFLVHIVISLSHAIHTYLRRPSQLLPPPFQPPHLPLANTENGRWKKTKAKEKWLKGVKKGTKDRPRGRRSKTQVVPKELCKKRQRVFA